MVCGFIILHGKLGKDKRSTLPAIKDHKKWLILGRWDISFILRLSEFEAGIIVENTRCKLMVSARDGGDHQLI